MNEPEKNTDTPIKSVPTNPTPDNITKPVNSPSQDELDKAAKDQEEKSRNALRVSIASKTTYGNSSSFG